MNVSRHGDKYIISCDNDDESNFMNFLLNLINGSSDKDFDDAVRKYKLNLVPCPATESENLTCKKCGAFLENQVFRCGMPAGHNGKRHVPFLIWKE